MKTIGLLALLPVALLAAGCAKDYEIIYPQEGMSVAAPVALDARSQGIVLSAAHSDPDAILYWHLDGTYLGMTTHGEHKLSIVPPPGPHTLTVIDANGHSAAVRFTAM